MTTVEAPRSGSPAAVLIPHWNRAEKLRRTLDALGLQTVQAPVVVVDNGSTDGTREMLARDFSEVRCLRMGKNRGFGTALNAGVRATDAPFLIFLNNDTVPRPQFVEEIVATQAASGAQMVAGVLVRPDGIVDSLGIQVDQSLIAYDVGKGAPLEEALTHAPDSPMAPSGGACGFVREAFLAVGGYDEEFFAYLEDVDLGIRMRRAGMRCALARAAIATHEHSATLGSGSAPKNRMMGRSRAYLVWKHGRGLSRASRARGLLVDLIVYSGQMAIDRNAGALGGRLREWRRLRRRSLRPSVEDLAKVPVISVSLRDVLAIRLRRRRPAAAPERSAGAIAAGG